MSETLETRAEIVKLARLLDVEPDRLPYLHSVSPRELASFRDQVTEVLYARNAGGLKRMAAASTLLPGAVAAALAQRVIGPVLCARLAGMIDPRKAVETTKHLSPPFLADVAVQIDPRRAKDVIALVPPTLAAQVAGELVRRREYVTMGRFVGSLGDDAIRASMVEIDVESLLRVAFVLEGKERLDHVISLLGDERFPGLIGAAQDAGLWDEALDLREHLGPELLAKFDALAASYDGFREALARSEAGEVNDAR